MATKTRAKKTTKKATTVQAEVTSSWSVKDFCSDHGITTVTKVRVNTNGYPFITFINESSEAENIYFSKSLAEELNLQEGDAPSVLKGKRIVELEYDNNEVRFKIAKPGSDEYVSVSDLF